LSGEIGLDDSFGPHLDSPANKIQSYNKNSAKSNMNRNQIGLSNNNVFGLGEQKLPSGVDNEISLFGMSNPILAEEYPHVDMGAHQVYANAPDYYNEFNHIPVQNSFPPAHTTDINHIPEPPV
jgi:hypothetical protein